MRTSVIADGAGQSGRHGKMRGGKVKVSHRGGKGQDRGKCRGRVWVEADTSDWWRPGRNAGARAEGRVGGRTICERYGKGRERAGWRTR